MCLPDRPPSPVGIAKASVAAGGIARDGDRDDHASMGPGDTSSSAWPQKMVSGALRDPRRVAEVGILVSERTVSRYLLHPRTRRSQTWRTFLANHLGDLAFAWAVTASFSMAITTSQHRLCGVTLFRRARRAVHQIGMDRLASCAPIDVSWLACRTVRSAAATVHVSALARTRRRRWP